MKECWANSLGDCGGEISREHYVSECVFPKQSIFVQGHDWCLERPKECRIETLTAKILCKHHNETLSELDAAAGQAFNSIRAFTETRMNRAGMPYLNWAPKQFTIDGRRLERWCLKTLLNFSFNRQLIIGPGNHRAGIVDSNLARIAFGLDEFTEGRGLYIAFREQETFNLEDRFGYTAKAQGPNLMMGHFRLHGFRFYLNLLSATTAYDHIEDSKVFHREAHFVDPVEPVTAIDNANSIESLIRSSNSRNRFRQKLSIAWSSVG